MGRKAKTPAPIVLSDEDTPEGPILETEEQPPALERDENQRLNFGESCCISAGDSTPEEGPEEVPVIKPKRKLTEKQIEALTAGRNKGLELKKQSKEITTERNEILSKVKEIKKQDKLENKREAVDDLKKFVESAELRKHVAELNSKFDGISSRFDSYLTEKQQRKADKVANVLETAVRSEVPKIMNKLIYEDKLRSEQGKYNPFLGRV